MQPSLGKLVKKEKGKKKCCSFGGKFLLFCKPPPPPKENNFRNSFFSENKVLFSAKCGFLKKKINFCDIIIVVIIISLGGKN